MLEKPTYFLRRAIANIRQSPVLCSATIGSVAVALSLLAAFAIVVINIQEVARQWEGEVRVIAYLDHTPPEDELKKMVHEIEVLPEVASVKFIDSDRAFRRFRERLQGSADLLDGLDPSILPASLELQLSEDSRTRQGAKALSEKIGKRWGFTDLHYGQEWLEPFEAFLTLLRLVGAVLGGFLLFAALFIVANTIRITLYARQDEVDAMVLVGATPLFIKVPFLLEGALQGALGGGIALTLSYVLYRLVLAEGLGAILTGSGGRAIQFLPMSFQLLLVAFGIGLGVVGSLIALRRFVRF